MNDRIEQLKDDVLGCMEVVSHQVAELKIQLMWRVGNLILEASEELNEKPSRVLAILQKNLGRGNRMLRYSVQTAEKFNKPEDLPLLGVSDFIRTELTEIKRIEAPKCKHCPIKNHCKRTITQNTTQETF